jgi:hypothetical protein
MVPTSYKRPFYTAAARRLGVHSAVVVAVLMIAYSIVLAIGLLTLAAPDQPIGDPLFSILEILIIAMVPGLVALMAVVHAWAPLEKRTLSLIALVFMSLVAAATGTLHFAILSLSRHQAFADQPWSSLVFAFEWPSVAYALDIVAWDIFFPLSMFFAAPVFSEKGLASAVSWLMIASGVLALAGLGGVFTGNMQVRNIGIVGYVGVFLFVVCLLGVLFHRTKPHSSVAGQAVGNLGSARTRGPV